MPQLDLSTFASQIFWLIISFGLFYFLNVKIVIPKIRTVIDEREKIIADNFKAASDADFEIEKNKSKYKKKILLALEEAKTMINNANDNIKIFEAEFLDKIEQENSNKFDITQRELDRIKNQINVEFLSNFTIQKIIQKLFNNKADRINEISNNIL